MEEKDELEVDVEKGNADSNFSSASKTIIDPFKAHMKVERKKERPRGRNSRVKQEKSRKGRQSNSQTVKMDIQRRHEEKNMAFTVLLLLLYTCYRTK